MPNYITRIELKSATQKDYIKLEEEMQKASFKLDRPEPTLGRKKIAVPAARQFNYNGNHSLLEVTGAAERAARKTGKRYSFTVIKERKTFAH